ncbi:putative Ras-related protein Rab-33 [Lepeophtheirus salmonis]|uniref:Ras-related protein Rab-33B n=1 Tax=Lepeophtheirus salmonis TaxID=72036 RepID=C1BV81_LEPSM|nr:putative Ras-related protein Rab-33 [Lepeophtheirus salmonis]ACO12934.1 Ras-related protein Rab-33B [Lepeophtheirus salmonis]
MSTPALDQKLKRRTFKVIVLGDAGVGKTCLTFRFCSGSFPDGVDSTIGVDFREKNLTVDGEDIRLQLWDTAGQERFRRSMISHYYRNANAVVFVYDINCKNSFTPGLDKWIAECEAQGLTPSKIPMVVLGNKADIQKSGCVPTLVAQRYADERGMPHFETSAKDDSKSDHVDAVFMTLAHKLKHYRSGAMFLNSSSSPEKATGSVRILYQNKSIQEEPYNCCYII